MWRDRTNLYISYRQSYSHHPAKKPRFAGSSDAFGDHGAEESRGLMSAYADEGDTVIEMDLLPPRWVDIQDEVTELLRDIALKAAKLDKMHAKHVLPSFEEDHVRRRDEAAIEQLTQEITSGFRACQKAVERIQSMVREAQQQGSVTQGEEIMAKNLQVSLAARIQEASANFRKKQSAYLNKMRQLGGLESSFDRGLTPVQNPYSDPSMMESDADKSFSQSTLQQTSQKMRQHGNDTAIVQREREINDIAQGIIELADIFKDLQGMVIDQGTMLDRIDYNVERMVTEVKGAEKELIQATNYQRRSTKRKILLLLLLLCIGAFILLLVKPKGSREVSHPPPTPPEPATGPD
ncbi:putative snare complex subunit [Phaeomoniella chlamydospora]|uniref:Putative snare complex subunit n=1 Tax=Phaeomoniella chlamydospora TaxID=158046 RepID=A0A0G2HLR8_PHACM|nr:putative snare complex subunit [Phaeomoniella chlamydospora]